MVAGLSTPLHLAASLLGLSAAVGLALVAGLGSPSSGRLGAGARLVAAGAVVFAAGHGLAGGLAPEAGEVAAWLRTLGLVVIAAGLVPPRLAGLPGAAVVVPLAPMPAAVVAAVAGAVAGLRVLVGRPRLPLLGAGLLLWGLAEAVQPRSPAAAAWLTVAGALSLGGWLWQASRRRLRAKFATAFVASLLAVVVLMAAVLSGLGAGDLVRAELSRLDERATQLAGEVAEWPVAARELAVLLSRSSETFLADRSDEQLAELFAALFSRSQDFFVVLGPDGAVRSAWPPEVASGSFLLALSGSPLVSDLLAGRGPEGGLLTVGGRVVGVGGVRFPGPRAEDPPLGALVTGRVTDEVWTQQTARALGVGVFIEVGGRVVVASESVEASADALLDGLGLGEAAAAVTLPTGTRYAAAAVVREPTTQEPVARVVTVSAADVIAQLEREQTRRLFLLALVGALLAGLVAAAITSRLIAPIRELTRAAAAVREGDLGVRAGVASVDEVGELGRTFDEMTTSLAAQSDQLREAATVQARLRARLEALTASMGDALVAVDAEGQVITFNRAAEALLGRTSEQVLGLPLSEVLRGRGPDDQTAADAVGPARSEETVGVQLVLDGGRRLVPTAATAAPVRDEGGEVLGRVLVLRDVTREAEIERMKTEFLSNVSHELRTPLTPIKGYAQVLARRELGADKTRYFANQILESSQRLERIVGMIVDFAALDSGRLQLRQEPVAVATLVAEVLDDWRARHPERDFRRRVSKGLPPVLVDAAMLRRCLDELLDNAVKFSTDKQPVSVTAEPDGVGGVLLSVRDRGVGIAPETLASVFTDFYQVDASETRHYGGLGLGLALVRRIVDRLGAEVSAESEPGSGTAFHLRLPAADDPTGAAGSRGRPTARPA